MSHSSGAQVEYVAQGDVLNTTSESFGITIHRAANVALSFFMALLLFALGCSIDVSRVKAHVWRPWGILVGLLCQFGVMPLAAFLLALASAVKPVQAVAFLIMGCSPGGTLSNIVTFWIDGDMDLSITMTSVSTVLALGMMPLCLLVYTRRWVDTGMIRIPYSKIGGHHSVQCPATYCGHLELSAVPRLLEHRPSCRGRRGDLPSDWLHGGLHLFRFAEPVMAKVQNDRRGDGSSECSDLPLGSAAVLQPWGAGSHARLPLHVRRLPDRPRPSPHHSFSDIQAYSGVEVSQV